MRGRRLLTVLVLGGGGIVGYNARNDKYEQFKKSELKGTIANEPYAVQVFLHLPLNALSRVWGKMCNVTLPEWSRSFLLGLYVKKYKCCLSEAENEDLSSYKCLSEFFKRDLKSEARPISQSSLVSPCDGLIINCGKINQDKIEHIKLKTYSLKYFLGPKTWKISYADKDSNSDEGSNAKVEHESAFYESVKLNANTDLYHCIIYLAPGDYHKFHSPVHWGCYFRRYFPGYLLSVSPKMASKFPELLNVNERVVYMGQWRSGFFSMAAVGATNVGSIKIYRDPELVTNQKMNLPSMIDLSFEILSYSSPMSPSSSLTSTTNLYVKKGEKFGEFNLGSTIVLIFEADKNFKFLAKPNDSIKYGQALGQ